MLPHEIITNRDQIIEACKVRINAADGLERLSRFAATEPQSRTDGTASNGSETGSEAGRGGSAVEEVRRALTSVKAALATVRGSERSIDERTAEELATRLQSLESLIVVCLAEGDSPPGPISGLRQQDSTPPECTGATGDAAPKDEFVVLGDAPSMTRIRTSIDQLSRRSRAPVMILGEFGTGKRHCARALHAATYPEGEFFELDEAERFPELDRRMAALRARSSAQSAVGLTVYVHEVAQVPAAVQLRLSKLLHEQSLQFRVVASSSRGLAQACKEGLLRSELVFRFPSELELPPLRDRKRDIGRMARHFAELIAARGGSEPTRFSDAALQRMQEHQWPGNLTELANFVERIFQEFGSGQVDAGDLPDLGDRPSGLVFHLPPTGIDFAELERELLMQALALAQNNQTRAASLLGLTRDQIRYRLSKFEIIATAGRGNSSAG